VCCSVWQCVAVCCSVLQCVAVCCSVLQCVAVCYSVLQCVAVCCSVLQCVAVCGSVLQCVTVCCSVLQCDCVHTKTNAFGNGPLDLVQKRIHSHPYEWSMSHMLACRGRWMSCYNMETHMMQSREYELIACCSVLQCVAVCCSSI